MQPRRPPFLTRSRRGARRSAASSHLALALVLLAACGATPTAPPPPRPADVTPAAAPTTRARPAPRIPTDWRIPLDVAPVSAPRGMVASDHLLASQAGAEVLRKGGNAVDAAVATAFALAVVFPQAGNIGGGGFLVLRTGDGKVAALDFRETAPRKAHRDMYLDAKGQPSDKSVTGHLAAGVPGSVAGLKEAHDKYGTLPWAELVAPAAKLADEGFVVDEVLSSSIGAWQQVLARFPASAKLYLPRGKPLAVGQTWKNPDLAATLRRIAAEGNAGFYAGQTARLIVAEMKRGGGIITLEDLRDYKPRWRDPVELDYRGHHIISMPPPSSGGLILALVLEILEGWDVGAMGFGAPETIHLEAEAMRRAFALRNEHLGDPDFVTVPRELFSEAEALEHRATISPARATPSSEVGTGTADPSKHTTHFSVVDGQGGAVAMTTTINLAYGNGVTVTGAGFLLNNEMDDFATAPGKPNAFGLVQGEKNAVAPGKRPLSSMSPTIVLGPDGKVLLVAGAAGGPTIVTSTLQIISNVIDHRMDVVHAMGAPRIHHQHLPDQLFYEPGGLDADVLGALGALGHQTATRVRIGDAAAILWDGKAWTAGAEPRNSGAGAAGY